MYIERRDLGEFRRLDSAAAGWSPDGLTTQDIDRLLEEFPEPTRHPAPGAVVDLAERRRRRSARRALVRVTRTVRVVESGPDFGGEAA